MPDLKNQTVLIIGAGPAIVGQSSECDEGALEASRALAATGCQVTTINSNPDAVAADDQTVKTGHIQPLTIESLSRIIAREKPHAVFPACGGRDGLHLSAQLVRQGILERHHVALWGLSASALEKVRDRDALKETLSEIDLDTPPIFTFNSIDAAIEKAQALGFPVVLRCNHTDLLPDGILVYNQDELREKAVSLTGEPDFTVSVEASLLEWQQIELEMLRDRSGQTRLAGGVTYIDTAGIHPGDAIGVSPPRSLSRDLFNRLAAHAGAIADHLDVMGSLTVRFAYQDEAGSVLILAVHPRYTRTSALVSRTSGLSIGGLSGLLAAGFTWSELPQQMRTPGAKSESQDVIAVKWPRWNFDQLKKTGDRLGPQMQAVGQTVAYGSNFLEALQKASRSATGRDHGLAATDALAQKPLKDLLARISTPASDRLMVVYEVLRRGASPHEVAERTHFAPWVVEQLSALAATDRKIETHQGGLPDAALLRQAKSEGFSNAYLAKRLELSAQSIERGLEDFDIQRRWTCVSANDASLYFSTFVPCQGVQTDAGNPKVLLLGSGGHGIGRGPECDYGLYHATTAVKDMGYTPILYNCNLTSVTSGSGTAAPCCCDPISAEDLLAVIDREKPVGIITQFAGTLSPDLMAQLAASPVQLLGTAPDSLKLVRDRVAFHESMRNIGIPQPMAGIALSEQDAHALAAKIQFPLLVQPAGAETGKGAELIMDDAMLASSLEQRGIDISHPLWIEQFLEYAIEVQTETLCDGTQSHVAAVLEHIELAGVHAGDSACVLPPYSIAPRQLETIAEYCRKVAVALKIKGVVNLRFAIYRDTVYLLEATCNATRNLSLVARTQRLPIAELATQLMLDRPLKALSLDATATTHFAVRAAVFPFNVFPNEDPLLGPQMRSTGQVLSMADSFGLAYFKAQQAATSPLPTSGSVLITVTDEDKPSILEPARIFQELGFSILATNGTQAFLTDNGIQSQKVRKLGFGRPNLLDDIKNGGVQMVINTPTGGQGQIDDSLIRKAAIRYRIANITTPASALAAAKGIAAQRR